MAFGSWIKKIGEKVKNFAQKAVPIVQKGLQFAADKVAPVLEKVGETVGGTIGNIASGIGKGIRTVNDRVQPWLETGKEKFLQPAYDNNNYGPS